MASGILPAAPPNSARRRRGRARRAARRRALPLHVLAADVAARRAPVGGETFVFTQFAGEPQCFLTRDEILHELATAGFTPDAAVPLAELDARTGMIASRGPVIYQGAFRWDG